MVSMPSKIMKLPRGRGFWAEESRGLELRVCGRCAGRVRRARAVIKTGHDSSPTPIGVRRAGN
jgi:hypothetical protein